MPHSHAFRAESPFWFQFQPMKSKVFSVLCWNEQSKFTFFFLFLMNLQMKTIIFPWNWNWKQIIVFPAENHATTLCHSVLNLVNGVFFSSLFSLIDDMIVERWSLNAFIFFFSYKIYIIPVFCGRGAALAFLAGYLNFLNLLFKMKQNEMKKKRKKNSTIENALWLCFSHIHTSDDEMP